MEKVKWKSQHFLFPKQISHYFPISSTLIYLKLLSFAVVGIKINNNYQLQIIY